MEKEDGERLIGIELKAGQVQAISRHNPHPNKLLQKRPQRRMVVDQIVIQLHAFLTGNATKDHHQGTLLLFRLLPAQLQLVVDPKALRLHPRPIGSNLRLTSIRLCLHGLK
jgi:hypothetical protein